MKRLLYSTSLMVLMLACHSNIFPADLLHQRWTFLQSRIGNGPWAQYYKPTVDDTEYQPDGTLVYRRSGQIQSACCQPTRFNRQQNNLTFADVAPCGYSICAGASAYDAVITHLTADTLELTRGNVVTQYTPVK